VPQITEADRIKIMTDDRRSYDERRARARELFPAGVPPWFNLNSPLLDEPKFPENA
jgi:hypothetical protein